MGTLKLDGGVNITDTLISNRFIDEYMPSANGEFVKIYLYLLRALSGRCDNLSVCHIADIFNHTEKDVIRALRYWEQTGLLDLCFDKNKTLTNITMKPIITDYTTSIGTQIEVNVTPNINESVNEVSSDSIPLESMTNTINSKNDSEVKITKSNLDNSEVSSTKDSKPNLYEKKVYTANETASLCSQAEVKEFIFLAENYLGKTLSKTDINTLLYIYDVLDFSPELIDYLIEYCVNNGHKSFRYIEKVALSWSEEGITDIKSAKATTETFVNTCYPVLKAFGLNGRNPSKGEKEYVVKWTDTYGFNMDIILEACNKTMDKIHSPSFGYTDKILSDWKNKGVKNIADINKVDSEYKANIANNTLVNNNIKTENQMVKPTGFSDFNHRTYDYSDLEKKLLNSTN